MVRKDTGLVLLSLEVRTKVSLVRSDQGGEEGGTRYQLENDAPDGLVANSDVKVSAWVWHGAE